MQMCATRHLSVPVAPCAAPPVTRTVFSMSKHNDLRRGWPAPLLRARSVSIAGSHTSDRSFQSSWRSVNRRKELLFFNDTQDPRWPIAFRPRDKPCPLSSFDLLSLSLFFSSCLFLFFTFSLSLSLSFFLWLPLYLTLRTHSFSLFFILSLFFIYTSVHTRAHMQTHTHARTRTRHAHAYARTHACTQSHSSLSFFIYVLLNFLFLFLIFCFFSPYSFSFMFKALLNSTFVIFDTVFPISQYYFSQVFLLKSYL